MRAIFNVPKGPRCTSSRFPNRSCSLMGTIPELANASHYFTKMHIPGKQQQGRPQGLLVGRQEAIASSTHILDLVHAKLLTRRTRAHTADTRRQLQGATQFDGKIKLYNGKWELITAGVSCVPIRPLPPVRLRSNGPTYITPSCANPVISVNGYKMPPDKTGIVSARPNGRVSRIRHQYVAGDMAAALRAFFDTCW